MLCLFRGRIATASGLSSSVFRIHARHPVNSNIPLLRGYATHKTRPGVKASLPPRPPPITSRSNAPLLHQMPEKPPPPTSSNDPKFQKMRTAERLFKSGQTVLYKSTRRTTTVRINSWAIILAAALAGFLVWDNGSLSIDTFIKSGHDYPRVVTVANALACLFFGVVIAMGGKRLTKHIHSIHLIEHAGKVQLQVTYRRILPFSKKTLIVQPHDFTISDAFAATVRLPDSLIPSAPTESAGPAVFVAGVFRESLKSISKSFFNLYEYFHSYFTGAGLYEIEIQGQNKNTTHYTMDSSADYLLNQKDFPVLWDVVETKDPYSAF